LDHPIRQFIAIVQKSERRIIGLISGTSADGIDAALVRIRGHARDTLSTNERIQVEAFASYPYPNELRKQLLAASLPGAGSVDLICRLNVAVGECFAKAALKIIEQAGAKPEEIDLIGSHGQTIHHLPFAEPLAGIPAAGTLQIGAEPHCETHRYHYHCRFSRCRHGARRPGRAARAVSRLHVFPFKRIHAWNFKHRRHCQSHHFEKVRRA
jgi:hypothetical protein